LEDSQERKKFLITSISNTFANTSLIIQNISFKLRDRKEKEKDKRRHAFLATQEHQRIFTWIAPK
jgi:hypothetical protein